jgi:hypothetical protein
MRMMLGRCLEAAKGFDFRGVEQDSRMGKRNEKAVKNCKHFIEVNLNTLS